MFATNPIKKLLKFILGVSFFSSSFAIEHQILVSTLTDYNIGTYNVDTPSLSVTCMHYENFYRIGNYDFDANNSVTFQYHLYKDSCSNQQDLIAKVTCQGNTTNFSCAINNETPIACITNLTDGNQEILLMLQVTENDSNCIFGTRQN